MPLFPVNYPLDKPNAGLEAVRAGHRLREHDGVWVVDALEQADADACQAWLDGYDDLGRSRWQAKERVKAECQRRILAAFPEWQQRNMTALAVQVLDKQQRGEPLTDAEAAGAEASRAAWAVVMALRAVSNEIEREEIEPLTDVYALDAFDPAASPRWPATS